MSERYDVRKLKREWLARLAAGEKPIDPQDASIRAQHEFEMRRRVEKLEGSRKIVDCHHGVPWLECRECSKPRRRP